jgi:hypothetical protein
MGPILPLQGRFLTGLGEDSPNRRRDGVGGGHRVVGQNCPDHTALVDDLDNIVVYDVVIDSGAVRQRVRRRRLRDERASRLLLIFGPFLVSDRDLLIEDVEAVADDLGDGGRRSAPPRVACPGRLPILRALLHYRGGGCGRTAARSDSDRVAVMSGRPGSAFPYVLTGFRNASRLLDRCR